MRGSTHLDVVELELLSSLLVLLADEEDDAPVTGTPAPLPMAPVAPEDEWEMPTVVVAMTVVLSENAPTLILALALLEVALELVADEEEEKEEDVVDEAGEEEEREEDVVDEAAVGDVDVDDAVEVGGRLFSSLFSTYGLVGGGPTSCPSTRPRPRPTIYNFPLAI